MAEESLEASNKKRQYISIFLCWFAYVAVYFGRYSFSANISLAEADYGVSHAEAGLVMTFFSVAYGCGQLVHGVLCKRYNRKCIVSVALVVAGVANLLYFIGIPFFAVKYLWLISAVFQSILWPMLMQIISENVGAKLMKTAILVMSTTTSMGTLCIYGLSAAFATPKTYKLTFLIGSFIIFSASVIWFLLYKPGGYIRMNFNKGKETKHQKLSVYFILPIILLGIFGMISNFLKDGVQTWVPVILKHIKPDLPDNFSILLTLVLPIFGIFGATLAVFVNKVVRKVIVLAMLFIGAVALVNFTVIKFQDNLVVAVVSFGLLELLLHGVANITVSIFPLSMREKMSTGALAGVLNGASYLGSAASSFTLGKIADVSGWSMVFVTLFGASVAALIFGAVYLIFSIKFKELRV